MNLIRIFSWDTGNSQAEKKLGVIFFFYLFILTFFFKDKVTCRQG